MKFIDLFAGLGGFHQALEQLGHECVFASELNSDLAVLHKTNFGIMPAGDIRNVAPACIPDHDILCAGFPCQPFSKAGEQKGFECPQWGDLFCFIIQILMAKRPQYLIIENVPNLVRHDEGQTWKNILHRLRVAGYSVDDGRISPHDLGIPQKRERAFIVGSRSNLGDFSWPARAKGNSTDISSVLDQHPDDAKL